jgi:hypothetical protein
MHKELYKFHDTRCCQDKYMAKTEINNNIEILAIDMEFANSVNQNSFMN